MTVQLYELSKHYDTGGGPVVALDAVTTTFAAASFTAVTGPSGSGKSTLLHCAAGLEPASSGRVLIDGTDLGALGENDRTRLRRDRVGFVFQDFNLVSALTAAQNVALPARLAGRRVADAEVHSALGQVGLADRAGHRPRELSGGQQQRVAIARALFTRPAVVFADEPTGALDTDTSRRVLGALRQLVDTTGCTVVMVTHDPDAAAVADRVVLLADGRITGDRTGADAVPPTGPGRPC